MDKAFVTTVANPIYDTVFKYLMEDERIARTILAALLQKDVQGVGLQRLLKAAASAEIRRKMDIEDEIYSALEKRDTIILQKDKQLEEQSLQLEAKDQQLEAKDQQLEAKDQQLEAKDQQLEAKDQQLLIKNELLKSSIKILLDKGLSEEDIASSMGISYQNIRDLLSE